MKKDSAVVIKELHLTEKGSESTEKHNSYFFRVAKWANKMEIKRAVEKLYGVTVTGVRTMNYRGKRKRERTVRYGRRADWKRAVVTLKEGSRIDLT